MIRLPPRSTLSSSSAASDVYKRQVAEHSTNQETIGFESFLRVVAKNPLKKLLPESQRDAVVMLAATARSAGSPQPTGEDGRNPERSILARLRKHFNIADVNSDGELEEDELARLLKNLWESTDKGAMPSEIRIRAVEHVREAMVKFDMDRSGKLNFNEFVRLVQVEPWRQMIPPDIRQQLPFLVMKLAHDMAPSSTDLKNMSTQEYTRQLQAFFDEVDCDGSGYLDETELVILIHLSLIHISEPTRLLSISYAVFCLKKKKRQTRKTKVI
eukprot:TRINITY_DN60540_c0_g1_i1.p1 TRINITY_DN60540_c0_g1~~TRINITY_DN60540_c0_g1_i1.p1  ORF type:complete len:271 (+),score=77.43 TRINITY_DN60540_c0_g1_i1:81-893(+)